MIWNNFIFKIKNEMQPFKTAIFTVVISVIATISVSTISEIGKQIINEEMNSIGLNGFTAAAYSSKGENMTNESFCFNISELQDIKKISPLMTETVSAEFCNDTEISLMCWGIGPEITEVISLENIAGRMINNTDIDNNSRVCLIDENIAINAYKRSNICGKKISINIGDITTDFTIIGTVRKNSSILNSLSGDVVPDFIYIPYSTMLNLSSKTSFDQIIFTTDNTEMTSNDLKNKLTDISYRYKNQYINLTNLSKQKEQINKIADTAFLSLFIVSCVAIVVCSLSVASSVNTAIVSKQKDIGIKISMGASAFNIISEFIFAALISCLFGVLVAVSIMFAALKIISYILPLYIRPDFSLIAVSIFATILLTAIFSFLPSRQAAKMPPIKALNRE